MKARLSVYARRAAGLVLLVACLLILPLALIFSRVPQFWIGGVWSLTGFVMARAVESRRARLLCRGVAVLLATWALAEGAVGYLVGKHPWTKRMASMATLNQDDLDLGFRLRPSARLNIPAHDGAPELTYSINADGLRQSPEVPADAADVPCVLFFGCSFTFGEGLNDEDTLPYQVSLKTRGRLQVRNFGVASSGPHYALGQIETGFVERAAKCTPTHAVYLLLPQHLIRIVGAWIARSGPHYVRGADGHVTRQGVLGERGAWEVAKDVARFSSAVLPTAFGVDSDMGKEYVATQSDLELYRAIMTSMNRRLLQRWPDIRFDVLIWDGPPDGKLYDKLGAPNPVLKLTDIPTHFLSAAIPGIKTKERGLWLPYDPSHPNAEAIGQVADFVLREVLHAAPVDRKLTMQSARSAASRE